MAARYKAGDVSVLGKLEKLRDQMLQELAEQEAKRSANAASQAYSQRLMGFGAAMQGLGTLNQSLKPPPPPTVIVPLGR